MPILEIVKANIELTELRAPFDGMIGLRQVSVGTYASPTTVVAKLTKIAPLKVEFSVPERYAKQIKKGTNLNFSVEGTLDAFGAQVYAVESAIDPNLHQFTARALYPNVNHILLPGRYTSVLLKKEEIPDAIAIPTEAIVKSICIQIRKGRRKWGKIKSTCINRESRTGGYHNRYPYRIRSASDKRTTHGRYNHYFRNTAAPHRTGCET